MSKSARENPVDPLPSTPASRDFPIGLSMIIILSVVLCLFKVPSVSVGSDIEARPNFNSLVKWDDASQTLSLYEELGIDAYSQRPTTSNEQIYRYFSPYEERFPTYELPYFAEKTIPYNDNVPTNKQVCFVHVGKAGGSTIGCSLGFSLHCADDGQSLPGLLPIITTHVFHRGVYDCQDDAAYHLFVVRDPLDRVMSAFNYDRPGDETIHTSEIFRTDDFYIKCPFWTLDDVAQNGLLGNGDASVGCQKEARQALRGFKEFVTHWYFNYQYYYEFLRENVKLLVIRNEHIVNDWNGIESMLGGHDVLDASTLPKNNVHSKNSTDLYLSEESRMALCRELCIEIQFYKKILRKAINLIEEDVQISLAELRLQCPIEADSDVCHSKKPDITEKILDRKGC